MSSNLEIMKSGTGIIPEPMHGERPSFRCEMLNGKGAYDENTRIHAYRFDHPEANDESAVVVLSPFAEGVSERMSATAVMLKRSLKEPRNVIVVPNNSYNSSQQRVSENFIISSNEEKSISDGHLVPYARKIWQYLYASGIEEIDVVGIEQGAAVAAAMPAARRKQSIRHDRYPESGVVRSMTLIDPPNVVERTPKKLLKALKRYPSSKVVHELYAVHKLDELELSRMMPEFSDLHTESLLARRSRNNNIKELLKKDPTSRALLEGLSRSTLGRSLSLRGGYGRAVIARGGKSVVSPTLESVDPRSIDLQYEPIRKGKEIEYDLGYIAMVAKHAIEPTLRFDITPEDIIRETAR